MPRETIHVAVDDLRAALTAVSAHASTDKKWVRLHRVRFTVATEYLCTVTATNGATAGHAIVSAWDADLDPDRQAPLTFDLTPTEVRELLTVHKAVKDSAEDDTDLNAALRIDVTDTHVTVTDVAGLGFDGKALQLPRAAEYAEYPDVAKLLAANLHRGTDEAPGQLVVRGSAVKLFAAAATAYGHPLSIEATAAPMALVVACGESFLGVMMPVTRDEDEDAARAGWRRDWIRRLPDPSGQSPHLMDLVWADASPTEDAPDTPADAPDAPAEPGPGQVEVPGTRHLHTVAFDEGTATDTLVDPELAAVDDLGRLRDATTLIIRTQFASAAMLQRKMGIGYVAAVRLLAQLEANGIITADHEDRGRETTLPTVLVGPDDLDAAVAGLTVPDHEDA